VITKEESLRRMFAQDGRAGDDLVLAWSGCYPVWDGYSSSGYLLTWHRCVVLRGRQVEVWTTQSGRPTRILARGGIDGVRVQRNGFRRKYERILVGGRRFWIRTADEPRIEEWRRGDW
jgi:hypothetical protein